MDRSPLAPIVNVENPLTYHCRLWGYVPGHSMLLLRAYKANSPNEDSFFIGFDTVLYMECPWDWPGIDFSLGSPHECREMIQKAHINITENIIDAFLKQHHLFKIDRPDCQVRIFAWNMHKLQEVPEIFRGSPNV